MSRGHSSRVCKSTMNYFNSSFRIKPGARGLKRSEFKRVPGTARMERSTLKKKREPPALTKVKRQVRERDNYTCQFPKCGKQYKSIDVHHVAKISQRPDLKLDPNNMICLCRTHHNWTDKNHDKAVEMGLLSTESYELAKKQEREAA